MDEPGSSVTMTDGERALVEWAILTAANAHNTQSRRYTNEPYIYHPLRVMFAAAELGMSAEAQAAAVLHDVVEDCNVSESSILLMFGEKVKRLVGELTDLQTPADGNRAERKEKALKALSIASMEAQTLKLIDLADNAVSIRQHDKKFWPVFRDEALAVLDESKSRFLKGGAHSSAWETLDALLVEDSSDAE